MKRVMFIPDDIRVDPFIIEAIVLPDGEPFFPSWHKGISVPLRDKDAPPAYRQRPRQ